MFKAICDWFGDFAAGVSDGFFRAVRHDFVSPCLGNEGAVEEFTGVHACATYECLPEEWRKPMDA